MAQNRHFFDPHKLPIVYPPGETLEEKLQEMDMSVRQFSALTNIPENTVMSIIQGDCVITPEMAVSFENVTKIPTYLWLRLQESYDEFRSRSKPSYSDRLRKNLKNSLIRSFNNSASIAP